MFDDTNGLVMIGLSANDRTDIVEMTGRGSQFLLELADVQLTDFDRLVGRFNLLDDFICGLTTSKARDTAALIKTVLFDWTDGVHQRRVMFLGRTVARLFGYPHRAEWTTWRQWDGMEAMVFPHAFTKGHWTGKNTAAARKILQAALAHERMRRRSMANSPS